MSDTPLASTPVEGALAAAVLDFYCSVIAADHARFVGAGHDDREFLRVAQHAYGALTDAVRRDPLIRETTLDTFRKCLAVAESEERTR